jgi:class 3 adenylate cyclase
MQLEQPGLALQRGQPADLKASCARRPLLPIAQVVQKGDLGLKPAGNPANVGLKEGRMETPAPLRKSLALVFCDIVGSTRLIARVGDLVVATVLREFREQAGRLAKENHCLIIKFLGDAFLATFENMDDVMPFVISIESLSLLSQNSTLIGHLEGFRFSLHYGNVLYIETSYGSDVLGEDVNVAAHLSEIAQPNEVVISQAALERMPADYQALAGAIEVRAFKRVGDVKFRRVKLFEYHPNRMPAWFRRP